MRTPIYVKDWTVENKDFMELFRIYSRPRVLMYLDPPYLPFGKRYRHTFAVKTIMDDVPLNVLQQWMGHSSVFTTSIYTRITGMDTSEFMERVR